MMLAICVVADGSKYVDILSDIGFFFLKKKVGALSN